MYEIIKKWLDGGCHYWKGVAIYASLSYGDKAMASALKKERTKTNESMLFSLLTDAYEKEKADYVITTPPVLEPVQQSQSQSIDLYMACRHEADAKYKEVMNKRAVLFSLATATTNEAMEKRRQLALDVAKGFPEASVLYDKAAFVKQHGHIPKSIVHDKKADPDVPDFMIWPTIDNLRKNINKIKKRPQTPERIELLQNHIKNLEALEKRWHLLKQEHGI